MKSRKNTIGMLVICLFIALIQIFSGTQVKAMTKTNQIAYRAYQSTLKKQKKRFCNEEFKEKLKYTYLDIDNDGIDELIIQPGYGYYSEGVFDYKNGKVSEVAIAGHGEFTKFYVGKKVIFISKSGLMGRLTDYYYKQSTKTNKYVLAAHLDRDYGNDYSYTKPKTITYYVHKKKVTKAKYQSYVKQLTSNSKVIKHSALKWKEC